MRKIIILPFAERDIKESVSYYSEKDIGLEKSFLKILNQAFLVIAENPTAFPIIKSTIRKFVLKDFPFNIFYLVENDHLYVLAVFHNKRNPKILKSRKNKSD